MSNVIFLLLMISFVSISSHMIISSSELEFVNATSENSTFGSKFLNYYDPYSMIKVEYPSYWKVLDSVVPDSVVFNSPIEHTGVIVQNRYTPEISLDEFSMNLISKIEKSFHKANVISSYLLASSNHPTQPLLFTYKNGEHMFKVLFLIKVIEDRTFIFCYYSDETYFDRFFPIAKQIYSSFQIPSFQALFPSDLLEPNGMPTVTQLDHYENFSNLLNYENVRMGFSLQYPDDLKKIDESNGLVLLAKDNEIGITISRVPLHNGSYEQFISDHLLSLNQTLPDFSILNSTTSSLLGDPTPMIFFTYGNGTKTYEGIQLWKLLDESVFLFTYFADSHSKFQDNMADIVDIIRSIKLREV